MFNNEKLKECRKQAGYTQLDMAKIIGVARTTYAEYEQGKIQPPIDKIGKIVKALPMLRGTLIEGVDDILVHNNQVSLIEIKNMREPMINGARSMKTTTLLQVPEDCTSI